MVKSWSPALAVSMGIQKCSRFQFISESASSDPLAETKGCISGSSSVPRTSIMPFCSMDRKVISSIPAVNSLIFGSDTISFPVGM